MKLKNLSGWLVVALLALATGLALGVAPASADSDADQSKIHWQNRYSMVLADAARAEARFETSRKTLRKARQRDRLKGEHRTRIYAEIEAAEREVKRTRAQLAKFPESARRAGIPPGWLREVEDRRTHDQS